MSYFRFSSREIEGLKREAKQYKRKHGCSHSEALNKVANKYGYTDWVILQKFSLDQLDPTRTARILSKREGKAGLPEIFEVAAIRCVIKNTFDPDEGRFIRDLTFRCPKCRKLHSTRVLSEVGEGVLEYVPSCQNGKNVAFNLVEVRDPLEAGYIPSEILENFNPDDPYSWFAENHELAVNISPWDGREGGYQYPVYDSYFDIGYVLQDQFPYLDEEFLGKTSEELFDAGPWVTAEFSAALNEDAARYLEEMEEDTDGLVAQVYEF